jgi:hypothetical protein
MQRFPPQPSAPPVVSGPRVLLFERNDAIAVPLLTHLRQAGYDVRAARIPVEVFDVLGREAIDLVLIDLGNAAANRREFWVGLDSQRSTRALQVLTFRYLMPNETGQLEEGLRVSRADIELQPAQGFGPLVEAVRARLPGAQPVPGWQNGPPPNVAPFPAAPAPSLPASRPSPDLTGANGDRPAPADGDASPFAQPYSSNPFKRSAPAPRPAAPRQQPPNMQQRPREVYSAFSSAVPGAEPAAPPRQVSRREVIDTWSPPEPSNAPPRRGVAYRGYNDGPLAPDDPRIDDPTSQVPAVGFDGAGSQRNDRALSTILMDSAVIAPQRLDALRSIQETLARIGMDFTLAELAMLFRFLTPDQLLAALLVSRGLVSAERIASLGRIKQELLATGQDYDLETLLVMFDVLPADEVRALRAELG